MADDQNPENSADLSKTDEQQPNKTGLNDTEKFRQQQKDNDQKSVIKQQKTELEELKKQLAEKEKSTSQLEKLEAKVTAMEKEKEKVVLEKLYPDIEPDLIVGLTPEKQKEVVEKQRKRLEEYNKNKIDINAPQYSKNEVDMQLDQLRKPGGNPIDKAAKAYKIMKMKRESA